MLSFFGTELSRRVRSHSQASLQASPDGSAVWGVVVSTRWWLLVDHCVLRNWGRILVRAVKGLISRAGMVSICPLLWQRDVKLQQTKTQASLQASLGMGPDEPGQHSFYSNLSSVMIIGARAQQTIDQSQTWYQNPRWRSLNTTGIDLSHVWCDPTYFHYPTTKSKK